MPRPLILSLVVLLTFALALYGADWLYPRLGWPTDRMGLGYFTLHRLGWYVFLPLAVLTALHGPARALPELGFRGSLLTGLGVSLLCTLPMLVGYALLFKPTALPPAQVFQHFYTDAVLAGLPEETLFRGFVVGQLYWRGRWPLAAATLVGAVFFASGHLYQGHDLASSLSVLGVTFAGALWFGWLLLRWRSLWVPVGLHVLMNAWWHLFDVADNAAGGLWANVFRLVTIGLSVWLTLRRTAPISRTDATLAGAAPAGTR